MQAGDQRFERHRDIDLDGELIVGDLRAQIARLGFDLVEGIAHRRKIGVAGLGEFGAPGVALEELEAEMLFQTLDLMADGRSGDAELIRRQPEGAEPGGGFESGQGT